jgi:hypothetical protein
MEILEIIHLTEVHVTTFFFVKSMLESFAGAVICSAVRLSDQMLVF